MLLDWVVNEDTYGSQAVITVAAGGIAAAPLTYPQTFRIETIDQGGNLRAGAAFPEGSRQFVKAVVGQITWNISVWAAGSTLDCIFRIVKKPFDAITGAAITDAIYALNDDRFANERFAWQRVIHDTFTAGTAFGTTCHVKATVNQWLEPDEALFLIYENLNVSGSIVFVPYLRTLMKADEVG